jgi:putative ABC transport system substrate-binding protein
MKNAMGDIPEVQRLAQEFVTDRVDMIVALSTPCFQAAMHATQNIPIVFSSVANPYLAGARTSDENRVPNVAGVSSRGPIKESLAFIREVMPDAVRIGTLWTPSELNSGYYLELARDFAKDLGFEIITVSVTNSSEVLLSTQVLINKNIDAIYQISDNTINAAFEAVGEVASENGVPLFGGQPYSSRLGACAALGWDFSDMGYKAGQIAIRVKNGENPTNIPFMYMSEVKLNLNLEAATKQGVIFPEEILERADEIIPRNSDSDF